MSDFASVVKETGKGVASVAVKGFLDAHSFEEFENVLNGLFEKSVFRVAVDLSRLEYVSSAGAGVLIGALSIAREHEGEIVLVGAQNGVREVFDLLGISQLFKAADTLPEAMNILAAPVAGTG